MRKLIRLLQGITPALTIPFFSTALLFFLPQHIFCQDQAASAAASAAKEEIGNLSLYLQPSAQLALSAPDYPVTSGDVYTLAYLANATPVEYTITVDSTYRVRISNLAVINAAGRTYNQLKTQVESIVLNNYPLSGVQFVLKEPAQFKVYLNGEVTGSREIIAWPLMRLSSIVGANRTAFSSTRDVTVTSPNGQQKTCDLFKADRFGDLSQNPYIRPEDRIVINHVERVVTLGGSVERPGTYQLLPGENIKELVDYYGNGFLQIADTSRMELMRYVESGHESGDKIFLSKTDIENNYPLQHLDSLYVPDITDLNPVMFVEGAVQNNDAEEGGAALATSNRLIIRFYYGENYASLVQRNKGWFTAISDTRNAYVIRGGERIMMNLNPMLYDSGYRSEYYVEHEDVLIVPFRQYFVTVAGAVGNPGRYPYIPDRDWEYYIAMAGGFDLAKNAKERVVIRDMAGKRMGKGDKITPETIITANTGSFLYNFNQVAPVVTTVLSIATTLISVFLLVSR